MESNSVCTHTRNYKVRLSLRGRPNYRPNWTPLSPITITNCTSLSPITIANNYNIFSFRSIFLLLQLTIKKQVPLGVLQLTCAPAKMVVSVSHQNKAT